MGLFSSTKRQNIGDPEDGDIKPSMIVARFDTIYIDLRSGTPSVQFIYEGELVQKRSLPNSAAKAETLTLRDIYGTMELANAPLLFRKTVANK